MSKKSSFVSSETQVVKVGDVIDIPIKKTTKLTKEQFENLWDSGYRRINMQMEED